jgi:tetratricopeptide (TPR) repeat protein
MRRDKGDIEGAIADYTKSIQINSNNADYYFSRGIVLSTKEDNINALADLKKASELAPEDGNIRASLVRVLRSLGLIQEAEEQEKIARGIIQKENEYNQACFEAICGNVDNALEFLKVGLEKGQVSKDWARQDPDFENIRDDPRFKELVHK